MFTGMVDLLLDRILCATLHLIYLLLDMILATHDDDPHTRNAAKRKLESSAKYRQARHDTRVHKQQAAAATCGSSRQLLSAFVACTGDD